MEQLVAARRRETGDPPDRWWDNTGYAGAARDAGLTGSDDPHVTYYHDVPRPLADEAISRVRAHPSAAASAQPWPLAHWPDVPTRVVLGTRDRLFPAAFQRRLAAQRLGVVPTEIAAGHCVALSRPAELADVPEAAR